MVTLHERKPPLPVIVVDPGHGGQDPGAVSEGGLRECDLNLSLAKFFLSASVGGGHFNARLLRGSDITLSLEARVGAAELMGAKALLSFHCNAFEKPAVRGYEVWTSEGVTEADRLARLIYDILGLALPYPGRPDFDDGDPDKEARFYVLRRTSMPAVLIEFGFLTNHGDAVWLASQRNQASAAVAVEMAVANWLRGECA